MNLGETIVTWLWRQRKILLALGILVSLGFALNLRHLGVDNSLDIWFLQDDPVLLEYREFQQQFGHGEVIVVALRNDAGMLDVDGINRAFEMSYAIAAIDGVDAVGSILTQIGVDSVLVSGDGAVTEQSIDKFKELLRDSPDLGDRWISADERLLVLVVGIDPEVNIDRERERILGQVKEVLESHGGIYHLAGFGVIYSALNQAATNDSALVTAVAYGLIFVMLVLVCQRIRPLLIIIGSALLGATAIMSFYATSGRDINMVTIDLNFY